ncbi:MAG: alpha-amylase, partial [Anaerolineales bacterium]|nr:alpha-amylase [Anaerolineales bacterium]
YRETVNPAVMKEALATLRGQFGHEDVDALLSQFCTQFPPSAVYQAQLSVADYLQGQTAGIPNREILLEELLFLWLANDNPAFTPYRELFDDSILATGTIYQSAIDALGTFFAAQPPFGPEAEPLLAVLQAPARRFPNSLAEQLRFVQSYFAPYLGPLARRLLTSLDLMAEEDRAYFFGPGPVEVIDFRAQAAAATGFAPGSDLSDREFAPEYEQFSQDLDWMPRLVLLAKNTYVWLDQLSKKYERPIRRLNEIPDEELDEMIRSGITGLWLIGLWERSEASRRIKHIMGKPDAVASAYSLYDYQIAAALGGDEAYDDLRYRARARGIRMSSDMVPNHMGIDSRWVIEHPDWFLSLPYSPYPTYSFNGPDLSSDGRVGIFLEDHYYEQSDAAVVFKRVDYYTGDSRFIYHGNDGTSMPWNDTAQLDFLNPEVREAVIQTILHVARRSSVIRFDAAMVLAKKHIQRLWHPTPGSGEGIASRAEFGLNRTEFNERMPVEFWREVVDRVAQEVPDTLLLAEAFWLMEGYFVRTLGMHRVYNSAFMHMMRDERNQEYRLVMKNTLEFNPEILKRYVNFMNNPDEETAIEQFGDGDKYFGVATLLATMPGLPMVGHGQIEGYTEKYGMEYQRAYYDENPKDWLVERHRREIFPLFRQRHLFAEVEHFRLYDFVGAHAEVNEDVFAYSNRHGEERALIIYHNKWATAAGWLRRSVGYAAAPAGPDQTPPLQFTSLADGLALPTDPRAFVIFSDQLTGLEYIRNCADLHNQGLYIELGGYKAHVFLNFRLVYDDASHRLNHLSGLLNGQGTASVNDALLELELAPVLAPYRALVNGSSIQRLLASQQTDAASQTLVLAELEANLTTLLSAIQEFEESE